MPRKIGLRETANAASVAHRKLRKAGPHDRNHHQGRASPARHITRSPRQQPEPLLQTRPKCYRRAIGEQAGKYDRKHMRNEAVQRIAMIDDVRVHARRPPQPKAARERHADKHQSKQQRSHVSHP
jgi:hypothetical protein